MTALTDRCYDCGDEYVPLAVDDGRCPECDSPATPLVGTPTVLDVRPLATFEDSALPEDEGIEVLVRDDTDRLIAYAFAVPSSGQPYAVAIAFEDATIHRGSEFWSTVEGPDCVAEAVADRVGAPPGSPPNRA